MSDDRQKDTLSFEGLTPGQLQFIEDLKKSTTEWRRLAREAGAERDALKKVVDAMATRQKPVADMDDREYRRAKQEYLRQFGKRDVDLPAVPDVKGASKEDFKKIREGFLKGVKRNPSLA